MRIKFSADSSMHNRRVSRRIQPTIYRLIGVIIGAMLAAVGLELFLMPHGIVTGGVTGLSALFALTTEMKLGLFLFLLNLPLLLLERKNVDASFALFTVVGLLVFSLGTILLHPYPALVSNPLVAAVTGGLSLGLGFGLALRLGGALDAAEKVSERYRNRKGLLPGGFIFLLNCSILLLAGFHFGFEQAVYSVTAYILAYESIKIPLHGLRLQCSVRITSRECERIQDALALHLNRPAAIRENFTAESGAHGILECKCHRWEAPRMKAIIKSCDPDSDIIFEAKPI